MTSQVMAKPSIAGATVRPDGVASCVHGAAALTGSFVPSVMPPAVRHSTDSSTAAAPLISFSSPAGLIVEPVVAGCAPLFKYAGGKTRLLPELIARMPHSFERYHEPFVGGGALYFRLVARGMIMPSRACIADVNEDLIGTYRAIAECDPSEICGELDTFRVRHGDATYYGARAAWNELRGMWSPAKRAATMLYLNRACFNGLWRVNSDGGFNVPVGKHKTLGLHDLDRLTVAKHALSGARIRCASFLESFEDIDAGDWAYIDPPYVPVGASANSSFTSYSKDGFGEAAQRVLADGAMKLAIRGVYVLVSNSDTPLSRELYKDFIVEHVEAPRSINSRGSGRGNVGEILARSY